ncbi:hypothetical protein B1C78_06425 [Thioalkalivibrio denitrificans]|uniref:Uncharacterized protein n=1 Tax=Thioalkalivibrio denitrificans TaxID=108003 RepID=A0A1V3NLI1_9GAMM|nr:hypothetical protein [Thioalkalivibrio denitrificans]OOG25596.1 hypothetical protein B1C78_06425 [Thioalkalivibrio denitrificans]
MNRGPSTALQRSATGILNPRVLTGAEIRRLQAACGETPCFGTDERYECQRQECRLAGRCMGGLVAHWKR